MFKAWKDLASKCALKAKGNAHFPDFPENHACVTGCTKKVLPSTRAGPHCWHLKTFLVHIQIGYIHFIYIYVHTHVTWMLACASCTSCSSAGALAISERASAAARSAASASEHSCNVRVHIERYNVYIQSVYVPEKFWGANNVVPRA